MRCAISGSATSKCLVPQCGSGRPSEPRHRGRCPMIPSNFDYVAPTTVDDAVAALAQAGEDAKVIAGGQSLMPVLRLRLAAPTVLVDLGKIDELRGVREDGDSIRDRRDDHLLRPAGQPAREQARAAARGRHPYRRGPADPASRHAGRRAGARGPGGRPVCAGARVGRHDDGRGPVRPPQHPGVGVLRGLLHHRAATGRNPHRDADSQAHRLGGALREAATGWRRPGRSWRSPRPSRSTAG